MMSPKVVTLCGSTRFQAGYEHAQSMMEAAGYLVFSLGVFGHAQGIIHTPDAKAFLDAGHLHKIMASAVIAVVVGPYNGDPAYYGDSTRLEIAWARSLGIGVRFFQYDSDGRLVATRADGESQWTGIGPDGTVQPLANGESA